MRIDNLILEELQNTTATNFKFKNLPRGSEFTKNCDTLPGCDCHCDCSDCDCKCCDCTPGCDCV